MRGKLTYGPKGRLISVLAMISVVVGALQASNVLSLLPPEYATKVGLAVVFVGLVVTGCSERIQGGASSPQVRHDAAQSDVKNASENEDIDLNDINC